MSFGFSITGDPSHGAAIASGAEVVSAQSEKSWGYSTGPFLSALRHNPPGAWSDNRMAQTNHFLGVTYIAINTICKAIGSCTIEITDRENLGGWEHGVLGSQRHKGMQIRPTVRPDGEPIVYDHPMYQLLESPNPQDTFYDFIYEYLLQFLLTGTVNVWLPPNGWGAPAEMYVVPTALMFPVPYSVQFPQGAWRITPLYAYGPFAVLPGSVSMSGAVIPAEQVLTLRAKHPLIKWDGYSPQTAISVQSDILESIDRARWNTFLDGVDPSAVFTIDATKGGPKLNDNTLKQFDERMREKFAGSRNWGRWMVLPPGVEAQPWRTSPDEMGFFEGWEQMRDFVLAAFGVPKGATGITGGDSYAALYASLKQFHLTTLTSITTQVQQHWTKHLGTYWSDTLKVTLHLPRLDDPSLLESQLANDNQVGIRTVDELRALRGLPPWGGEIGRERVGGKEQLEEAKADEQEAKAGQLDAQAGATSGTGDTATKPQPKKDAESSLAPRVPKNGGMLPDYGQKSLPSTGDGNHDYACALFKVSDYQAVVNGISDSPVDDLIADLQEQIDPRDLGEEGFEFDSHVTCLYGLETNDPAEIAAAVEDFGPVKVKFGPTAVFANDAADVLYVEVRSVHLHRLNAQLATLPHCKTHPNYVPHLCLAYLKPGTGEKYVGLDTLKLVELTFHTLTFCDQNGTETTIRLVPTPVEVPTIREELVRALQAVPSLNGHAKSVSPVAGLYRTKSTGNFQEEDHPRDENGHWVDKDAIANAARNPKDAAKLRDSLPEDQKGKFDKAVQNQHGEDAGEKPAEGEKKPETPKGSADNKDSADSHRNVPHFLADKEGRENFLVLPSQGEDAGNREIYVGHQDYLPELAKLTENVVKESIRESFGGADITDHGNDLVGEIIDMSDQDAKESIDFYIEQTENQTNEIRETVSAQLDKYKQRIKSALQIQRLSGFDMGDWNTVEETVGEVETSIGNALDEIDRSFSSVRAVRGNADHLDDWLSDDQSNLEDAVSEGFFKINEAIDSFNNNLDDAIQEQQQNWESDTHSIVQDELSGYAEDDPVVVAEAAEHNKRMTEEGSPWRVFFDKDEDDWGYLDTDNWHDEDLAEINWPGKDKESRKGGYKPRRVKARPAFRIKADWEEDQHPRGQPKNAGQFASGAGTKKVAPDDDPKNPNYVDKDKQQETPDKQQEETPDKTAPPPKSDKLSENERTPQIEVKPLSNPVAESGVEDLHPDAGTPTRDQLLSGKTIHRRPVGLGANGAEVIVLETDGGPKKAVFKPTAKENASPPWIGGNLAGREVAASEVAGLLGLDDLVPATVSATGDEHGSAQAFVPGSNAYKVRAEFPDGPFDGEEDLARAAAFDYLTLNVDRHFNNWMLTDQDKLVLIDNGWSFPNTHEIFMGKSQLLKRVMDTNAAIPEQTKQWLEKRDEIRETLYRNGISGASVDLTMNRLDALAKAKSFRELVAAQEITDLDAFSDATPADAVTKPQGVK